MSKQLLTCWCFLVSFSLFGTESLDYTRYVNPFVGTAEHGHTYPGASVPFGFVQLSPDTRIHGWDSCSGYHHDDSSIMGFSHTHLSGTGIADYSDLLMMPTVDNDQVVPGNPYDPSSGFRSRFNKQNEFASPGYYRVLLDDYGVTAELTATARAGFHRYTYPESSHARIVLDLEHRSNQRVVDSYVKVVSPTEIIGYRHSSDWARKQYIYFYAVFSKPLQGVDLVVDGIKKVQLQEASGRDIKALLHYQTEENEQILVKVGVSAVDIEGARQNVLQEIPHWDFSQTKELAKKTWNRELSKIQVESRDIEQKKVFYTSMYHSLLAPNIFMDVDGRYRGIDHDIHRARSFENYTVFSLWDTYRALHPLLTIIHPKKTNELIKTLLAKYDEGGILPIWELAGNYTGTMIGYHAVPVIVDAYMKGIRSYDVEKAYEAIKHSAMQDKLGLRYYKEKGYIPYEWVQESVSRTLEYAYDDWTIAQMAKELGQMEDYRYFYERSKNYQNIFDLETHFTRPKDAQGQWKTPFDPLNADHRTNGFTEGNAWQYTWYVPHDVQGLVELMGGREKFEQKLDALFSNEDEPTGDKSPDISGMIGQYAHGNEPSHHIAYLYNDINRPHKTQALVRQIMSTLYSAKENGLSGNEDCGQMSAWFILSSMGFYPVAPGSNYYHLGSPIFDKAVIKLENGKKFTVISHNNTKENKYVVKTLLNGKEYKKLYLNHEDIVSGSTLEFMMSSSVD